MMSLVIDKVLKSIEIVSRKNDKKIPEAFLKDAMH